MAATIFRLKVRDAPMKKIKLKDYDGEKDPYEDAFKAVALEWEERKAMKQRKDAEKIHADHMSDNQWLLRYSYDLLTIIIDRIDAGHIIATRNRLYGRYRDREDAELNIFQTGLMAIFAHRPRGLSSTLRSRLGMEMFFAFRHYVPSEFVLGFLTHLPVRSEINTMLDAERIDEASTQWVIRKRILARPGDRYRGSYPTAIERQVSARRRRRAEREGPFSLGGL